MCFMFNLRRKNKLLENSAETYFYVQMVCEKYAMIVFWKLCPTEEDLGILMLSAVIGQEGEKGTLGTGYGLK
jgi:hypothetical protein